MPRSFEKSLGRPRLAGLASLIVAIGLSGCAGDAGSGDANFAQEFEKPAGYKAPAVTDTPTSGAPAGSGAARRAAGE